MSAEQNNWFDQGGEAYARYRPTYPEALAAFLGHDVPGGAALDVGCGNGQLTCQLAEHVASVVGVDPSADQLAHAQPHPRVRYACAPAEATGLPARSVGLVTAAQAAHWFDLPRFHGEVRRVATPGARVALVSYGAPELEPDLDDRFQHFYRDEIGPYWPPERALVDSGYATMDFPFTELPVPAMDIERSWTCADLLGYISTWSATRRAREAGREDLLVAFGEALTAPWGTGRRRVRWPVRMRMGRVE